MPPNAPQNPHKPTNRLRAPFNNVAEAFQPRLICYFPSSKLQVSTCRVRHLSYASSRFELRNASPFVQPAPSSRHVPHASPATHVIASPARERVNVRGRTACNHTNRRPSHFSRVRRGAAHARGAWGVPPQVTQIRKAEQTTAPAGRMRSRRFVMASSAASSTIPMQAFARAKSPHPPVGFRGTPAFNNG